VTGPEDGEAGAGGTGGGGSGGRRSGTVRVAGFLPSTHGLRFDNSFPSQPAVMVNLGIATIPVGNAANGLCGGMVFAALDYWTEGAPPPTGTTPPAQGTPLFGYLVRRLVDSWGLPAGPLTYFRLMSPALPDGDRRIGPVTVHGRAWRMAVREWPGVKADLDAGRPSPLGLVKLKSANPVKLGANHQVLCYGYEQTATAVRLRVYDPNQAGVDHVTISLNVGRPRSPIPVTMAPTASDPPDVLCFFRVRYTPRTPPR
jgi:hypothetical protein